MRAVCALICLTGALAGPERRDPKDYGVPKAGPQWAKPPNGFMRKVELQKLSMAPEFSDGYYMYPESGIGASVNEKAKFCPNPAVSTKYKKHLECQIVDLFGKKSSQHKYSALVKKYDSERVRGFRAAMMSPHPWLHPLMVFPPAETFEKDIGKEEEKEAGEIAKPSSATSKVTGQKTDDQTAAKEYLRKEFKRQYGDKAGGSSAIKPPRVGKPSGKEWWKAPASQDAEGLPGRPGLNPVAAGGPPRSSPFYDRDVFAPFSDERPRPEGPPAKAIRGTTSSGAKGVVGVRNVAHTNSDYYDIRTGYDHGPEDTAPVKEEAELGAPIREVPVRLDPVRVIEAPPAYTSEEAPPAYTSDRKRAPIEVTDYSFNDGRPSI